MMELRFSPRGTGLPAAPQWPGIFQAPNPPMAVWQGRRVWLVGASSGIGLATAQALLQAGATVYLTARNGAALQAEAERWSGARALPADACDRASLVQAAQHILQDGPIDCAVYCAGHYRALRATDFSLDEMLRHEQVNYVGALHMLDAVLPDMLRRQAGHISLVSSVAGYRGLPNGLAYGPTKAALINLAETLWLDLRGQGIGVSLVNPGFVQTPLTAQNAFTMPALISPEQAAAQMLRGWSRGKFEIHFPRRFTAWLKLLRMLPFGLYQRSVRMVTGL